MTTSDFPSRLKSAETPAIGFVPAGYCAPGKSCWAAAGAERRATRIRWWGFAMGSTKLTARARSRGDGRRLDSSLEASLRLLRLVLGPLPRVPRGRARDGNAPRTAPDRPRL